jgi:hypothetical protein
VVETGNFAYIEPVACVGIRPIQEPKLMQNARSLQVLPLLFAVFVLAAGTLAAQERKAPFVDEGGKDSSFTAYRDTLIAAIAGRDVDTVVASAAPDIHLDFGGGEGRDEFRNRLTATAEDFSEDYAHLADEYREQYWDALEEVLRLGGVFRESTSFVAPYTWAVRLSDDEDPFTTSFIIGSDVPLRSRPSRYGDAISVLDEDIVRLLDGGKGTDFREVRVRDGRTGFVHKDHLRSAIDYRATFENAGGRWLMTMFITGD